jgi:hypothetical protein
LHPDSYADSKARANSAHLLSPSCVTLTCDQMEDHVRISTILEFFEQHRCIVFVTARTTCTAFMSHFAMSTDFSLLIH